MKINLGQTTAPRMLAQAAALRGGQAPGGVQAPTPQPGGFSPVARGGVAPATFGMGRPAPQPGSAAGALGGIAGAFGGGAAPGAQGGQGGLFGAMQRVLPAGGGFGGPKPTFSSPLMGGGAQAQGGGVPMSFGGKPLMR